MEELKKILPYTIGAILILLVAFSFVTAVRGATPNPGHPWTDIGSGLFQVSSTQTALHSYVFPDATATVLTDANTVTVAQGGTGATTFTSGLVLQGNGTGALTTIATGTIGNVLTATTTGWQSLPPGFQFLGSTKLGSNAANTAVVTIPVMDEIFIAVRITGYTGNDIASLRFNGDTGNNYISRYLSSVAGGVVFANTQFVSTNMARVFATTTTLNRSAWITISNDTSTSKVGTVLGQTGTGNAGTAGLIQFGGFEWVNTTARISSVQLVLPGGQQLNTGSGFAVYGRNF